MTGLRRWHRRTLGPVTLMYGSDIERERRWLFVHVERWLIHIEVRRYWISAGVR